MWKRPACPNCARKMLPVPASELVKPHHDVYRCDPCRVIFAEASELRSRAADRALDLNFGTDTVRH